MDQPIIKQDLKGEIVPEFPMFPPNPQDLILEDSLDDWLSHAS